MDIKKTVRTKSNGIEIDDYEIDIKPKMLTKDGLKAAVEEVRKEIIDNSVEKYYINFYLDDGYHGYIGDLIDLDDETLEAATQELVIDDSPSLFKNKKNPPKITGFHVSVIKRI